MVILNAAEQIISKEKMIAVATFLEQKRAPIYQLWMAQQKEAGSLRLDLMSQEDLDAQSDNFLDALLIALHSGEVGDISGSAYKKVREMLIDISRSRAMQGFTPSETATFIFSLKDAFMQLILHEYKDEGGNAHLPLVAISQLIDKLGLQTFEAYAMTREVLAREQADTILSMATPVTILWDNVLLLPIVGAIDSARAQDIMDVMLDKIQLTESKVILLDILGVATVDSAVAQHLIKITKATALMGCRCVVTGISPQIAQALVHLGLDLGDVETSSTLKNGLTFAFDHLHLTVVAEQR